MPNKYNKHRHHSLEKQELQWSKIAENKQLKTLSPETKENSRKKRVIRLRKTREPGATPHFQNKTMQESMRIMTEKTPTNSLENSTYSEENRD